MVYKKILDVVLLHLSVKRHNDNSVEEIQLFQNAEAAYAVEIADMLSVPVMISHGQHDADMALQYIADIVRNKVE